MKDRHILLGVTGGIAAYKSADITSKLVQKGALVTVVMTRSATRFVGPLTFEALTHRQVHTRMWRSNSDFSPKHIALADRADIALICPATANIIGKMANGLADDLLSTILLGLDVPIVVAPAMNTRMWNNPAVQRNVRQLRETGCHIVEPGVGYLACGDTGKGRLADVGDIVKVVEQLLESTPPG